MDTSTESTTPRKAPWWQVRYPVLFYVIGATFLATALLRWFGPDHGPVFVIVLSLVVAALNFVAATATIVRRRRTGIPALEFTPQAQESDPNRR